jgi:hypothetical protein
MRSHDLEIVKKNSKEAAHSPLRRVMGTAQIKIHRIAGGFLFSPSSCAAKGRYLSLSRT